MKKVFFLCVLFFFQNVLAQYNELGIFIGGANAVSDVGKATYIHPNKWAFGLLYKRNLHNRLALRADIKSFTIWDNDAYSNIEARKKRHFSFENKLTEAELGIEYNFLDFKVHSPFAVLFTPYFRTGAAYFRQDNLYFKDRLLPEQTALIVENERLGGWAIPFSLGVKTRLGETRFLIGAEIGFRYTFTNNLDGSRPENQQKWFGNLNANDWYFISGIYVTYTFGQKPCLCF